MSAVELMETSLKCCLSWLQVVLAVVGAHALPVRERRLTDSDMKGEGIDITRGHVHVMARGRASSDVTGSLVLCPCSPLSKRHLRPHTHGVLGGADQTPRSTPIYVPI